MAVVLRIKEEQVGVVASTGLGSSRGEAAIKPSVFMAARHRTPGRVEHRLHYVSVGNFPNFQQASQHAEFHLYPPDRHSAGVERHGARCLVLSITWLRGARCLLASHC
ncbi:hypothetical protein EYF80_000179 [Liparis tanakae]|uniref:Uncharacterized protein n=1 Tax=Liparis tanakae TaxID=230148 RepID=A0A4Z2JH07_9TELE|nr:hypothetical protein EYF80_000179 [Liparis tanakae]